MDNPKKKMLKYIIMQIIFVPGEFPGTNTVLPGSLSFLFKGAEIVTKYHAEFVISAFNANNLRKTVDLDLYKNHTNYEEYFLHGCNN